MFVRPFPRTYCKHFIPIKVNISFPKCSHFFTVISITLKTKASECQGYRQSSHRFFCSVSAFHCGRKEWNVFFLCIGCPNTLSHENKILPFEDTGAKGAGGALANRCGFVDILDILTLFFHVLIVVYVYQTWFELCSTPVIPTEITCLHTLYTGNRQTNITVVNENSHQSITRDAVQEIAGEVQLHCLCLTVTCTCESYSKN